MERKGTIMNCPHCGAPNPEEATTCRECGRPLPAEQIHERPFASPTPTPGAPPKTADTAIASLICGILSWSFLPFAGAVLAVILGHMAKVDIRQSEGRLGGDSLATLGLLLGYANLALAALGIILVVFLVTLGLTIPIGIGICGLCGAY
jgi:hypothetical protein